MKSYTDIEQSYKLTKILPTESANMWYSYYGDFKYNPTIAHEGERWFLCQFRNSLRRDIPCWSLATLLNVIPKCIGDYNVLRMDINNKDFSIWYDEVGCGVNNKLPDITMKEPVDACVEMILKLHELDLL